MILSKFQINFSKRDQVDYLTVVYFESSWNLENLELECGPAQPNLFSYFFAGYGLNLFLFLLYLWDIYFYLLTLINMGGGGAIVLLIGESWFLRNWTSGGTKNSL